MKNIKIDGIICKNKLNFVFDSCKIGKQVRMNELENVDNINIDELYNKIVERIEKAKRDV